jgi:predicted dehydrogenase
MMQMLFVTGLELERVSARLEKFVPGRPIDDHFTAYGELSNGGKCLVRASQICIGHKNDLGIVIAGTKGGLRWRQEEPEQVTILLPDQPDRIYWRGAVSPNDGFLGEVPEWLLDEPTIPAGHGEAFHDAYARLHREFEKDVRAYKAGEAWSCDGSKYANIFDGHRGLAFIDACLKSDAADGAWEKVPKA